MAEGAAPYEWMAKARLAIAQVQTQRWHLSTGRGTAVEQALGCTGMGFFQGDPTGLVLVVRGDWGGRIAPARCRHHWDSPKVGATVGLALHDAAELVLAPWLLSGRWGPRCKSPRPALSRATAPPRIHHISMKSLDRHSSTSSPGRRAVKSRTRAVSTNHNNVTIASHWPAPNERLRANPGWMTGWLRCYWCCCCSCCRCCFRAPGLQGSQVLLTTCLSQS